MQPGADNAIRHGFLQGVVVAGVGMEKAGGRRGRRRRGGQRSTAAVEAVIGQAVEGLIGQAVQPSVCHILKATSDGPVHRPGGDPYQAGVCAARAPN